MCNDKTSVAQPTFSDSRTERVGITDGVLRVSMRERALPHDERLRHSHSRHPRPRSANVGQLVPDKSPRESASEAERGDDRRRIARLLQNDVDDTGW